MKFLFLRVEKAVYAMVVGLGFLLQVGSSGEDPVHYPAYQVAQSYDGCLRLGVDATSENTRWSLNGDHTPSLFICRLS